MVTSRGDAILPETAQQASKVAGIKRKSTLPAFAAVALSVVIVSTCWTLGKRGGVPYLKSAPTVPLICVFAAWCTFGLRRVHRSASFIGAAVFSIFALLWIFAELFIEFRPTSIESRWYVAGTPSKYSIANVALAALNGMVSAFAPASEAMPVVSWEQVIPEAELFTKHAEAIRTEVEELIADSDIKIPRYGEVDPLQSGDKWGVFAFKYHGDLHEANCARCPTVCRILEELPQIKLAMLSILDPGAYLGPHYGVLRQIMRLHYPIIVPEGATIDVDGTTYMWNENELMLFDDTYLHSVRNDADSPRVVIFMNVIRPSTPRAFSWLLEAIAGPYLRDVNKRIEAASKVKM